MLKFLSRRKEKKAEAAKVHSEAERIDQVKSERAANLKKQEFDTAVRTTAAAMLETEMNGQTKACYEAVVHGLNRVQAPHYVKIFALEMIVDSIKAQERARLGVDS